MNKDIPITVNFDKTKQVGVVKLIDNGVVIEGKFSNYRFEAGIQTNPDGTTEIIELSIVPKEREHIVVLKVTDSLFNKLRFEQAGFEIDKRLIEDENFDPIIEKIKELNKL